MKDNEKKLQEMTKMKEENDKLMLRIEIILGLILFVFFMAVVMISSLIEMSDSERLLILVSGLLLFLIASFFLLEMEQKAGYYECGKCHHKYVPTYKSVLLAMHIGRTRYMKCPEGGEKSWQKKVLK